MYRLQDYLTKNEVSSKNLIFTGKENPWEVQLDLKVLQAKIDQEQYRTAPPSFSKYLPFLPLQNPKEALSLQEGATPLLKSRNAQNLHGIDLYFKLEAKSPTGSFKDRGSAVELGIAKEKGAKAIAVASTGNMAASCACYAAASGIPCFVFVPEDVPQAKLAQVIAFGGRIVQVRGSYNDAARLAYEACERLGMYLAGDYAFRIEGAKTAAFEVIDQLKGEAPDYVIVPMGCGTNLASYWKGFQELHAIGLLDKLPRIIGVQASGASPIVQAVQGGARTVRASLGGVQTLASSIAVGDPLDGQKALDAIQQSGGRAYAISDEDMLRSQYQLSSQEGLFSELSGAAAYQAIELLLADGIDLRGKKCVCVLCGDGLKDPSTVLRVAIKPPTIRACIEDFEELYEQNFFKGNSVSFFPRESCLFSEVPEIKDLEKVLRTHLDMTLQVPMLNNVQEMIGKFLRKGKKISFADLQDIVQDSLAGNANEVVQTLRLVDFDIRTGKDVKPRARVAIEVKGALHHAESEGTGPVDAVISALRKACRDHDKTELTNYHVGIRSQGPDAVVQVELKLRREGVVHTGRGASPDIIQASIEAFIEAYNAAHAQEMHQEIQMVENG